MTENTRPISHDFTIMSGLGFAYAVFKARPLPVLALLIAQLVLTAGSGLISIYFMAQAGAQLPQTLGNDQAYTAFAAINQAMLMNTLVMFASLFVYIWLEAVWLRLFMKGEMDWLPGWAVIARLTVSFIIIFGLFFVLYIAAIILVTLPAIILFAIEQTSAALIVGGLLIPVAIIGMLLVLGRFTALPAYVVLTEELAVGGAIKGAKRTIWRVIGAWTICGLVYLIAVGLAFGFAFLTPTGHSEMFQSLFANLEDPFAQYRVYAEIFETTGGVALYIIGFIPLYIVMLLLGMLTRGVGAKLALSIHSDNAVPER